MELNLYKLIGKGGFADVYLAKDNKNQRYAAKKIKMKNLDNKLKYYLQNEINILKMINHPNIIKLYNVIKSPNSTILVMEYCNGGSLYEYLYSYITQKGKPFSEKLVQHLMKQLLSAIKCLHEQGIIHRDLKLENILLKYDNDNDFKIQNIYAAKIKIIDFNLSYKQNQNFFKPVSMVGTPIHMAPTIVGNIAGVPKIYDEKVDIWSLGTLCYEMLFGKPLFKGFNENEVYLNILKGNYNIPNTISSKARSFLLSMLRKDGINRLSAAQLLKHEFILEKNHQINGNNKNQNIKFINPEKVIIKDNIAFNQNNNNIIKHNNNNNKINNVIKNNNNNNNNNINNVFNNNNNIKIDNFIKNNDKNRISPTNNANNYFNIKCNGCGIKPIYGILYKCTECYEVIYCRDCFQKFNQSHKHVFLIKAKKEFLKEKDKKVPKKNNNNLNENHQIHFQENNKNNINHCNTYENINYQNFGNSV